MGLQFHNTLTQRQEPFAPLDGKTVRMYTCGPTVYHYVHIGNFRTFSFQDILRRTLRARGYGLNHVMNITDVEDKIIRDAIAAGKTIQEYTAVYTKAFMDDSAMLRLEPPEQIALATEHINDMVERYPGSCRGIAHLPERRLHILQDRKLRRLREAFAHELERQRRRSAGRR